MRVSRRLVSSLFLLAFARPGLADESGSFVVTLGQDTTSIESYTRSKDRLEIHQVGRSPRVLRRHFTYGLENGVIRSVSMVVTPPASDTATQIIEAKVDGDSLRSETRTGTNPAARASIALPAGSLIVAGSSPWAGYEMLTTRFARAKADTLGGTMFFLGATNTERWTLKRVGRDTVTISNTRGDIYDARVDKSGRILGTRPIAGTQKFAITRQAALDLAGLTASYAAREKAGAGLGVLSPRDTVRVTNAGGASLTIDYSRPAKRGRVIFGVAVPYGEVWRTGANAATQLKTDRALDFGGNVIPAGTYTLWTVPSATGWKFIVNSDTGEWGTAHKPEKDLFSIDMKVSTLPQVVERFTISVEASTTGGVLNLDWDTTRASIAFTSRLD